MKTEIERINEITETLLAHQPIIDVPYEKINDIAIALIKAGYGDVSEYKAEIRELKADLDHQIDATNDAENLADHLQYDYDKTVKQAQIDTINTIIKYCENSSHWNELKDCKLWGGKSDDLRDFLNGIFKEVEKQ